MRVQSLLSALASLALLGAAALLAATAPGRAVPIRESPSWLRIFDGGRVDGSCGNAVLSRPNLEAESGYARPAVTAPAALRCASERSDAWNS